MISLSNVIKRQIVFERDQRTIFHQTASTHEVDQEPVVSYEEMMNEGQNRLKQQRDLIEQQEQKRRVAFEQERMAALEEARQRGYEEGFQSGQQAGLDHYQQRIDETNQFANRLEQMFSDRLVMMEDELCALALQLTHQFLEQLHDTDEEALYQTIHQLILQFRDREKLIVYTSAEDFERVVLLDERLHTILGGTATISLRIDPELAARDFRVDSENGAITGGLTAGYQTLLEQLTEVLHDV
ncbi:MULTISPECIES: FliH/SctL family protein [Exiguobacterium]|uniref:FliH/SctL family protein n=1 Tax=Exiguobacterium TaxID=33986 RepID=UPI000552779B|nr:MULTISPECIES: FliH/SctL family protein [Exiguobacterium]MCT4781095.1 FliH/SctL family protein [Exiguobacterium soli]